VDDLIVRVPKHGDVRSIDIPGRAPANVGHHRVVLLKERAMAIVSCPFLGRGG
jgi:hypothetical protein